MHGVSNRRKYERRKIFRAFASNVPLPTYGEFSGGIVTQEEEEEEEEEEDEEEEEEEERGESR
jgi:hypothetical protein